MRPITTPASTAAPMKATMPLVPWPWMSRSPTKTKTPIASISGREPAPHGGLLFRARWPTLEWARSANRATLISWHGRRRTRPGKHADPAQSRRALQSTCSRLRGLAETARKPSEVGRRRLSSQSCSLSGYRCARRTKRLLPSACFDRHLAAVPSALSEKAGPIRRTGGEAGSGVCRKERVALRFRPALGTR
jgi:hypothetical protein